MNEHVNGLLLGLVAGDKIGGPGQMALNLAESLQDVCNFDKQDIGLRYLHWWKEDGYDSGPIAANVFRLVNSGEIFEDAAAIIDEYSDGMTAGCNPVHRNTVLAMSKKIPNENLSDCAKEETRLTHRHNLAGEVASTACLLSRYLIEGISWNESLAKVTSESSIEIQNAFNKSSGGEIYPDGYAPHVLSAAIYFVNNGLNFDDALQNSIEFASADNYCPVLVGSLAGARWGASSIDGKKWLTDVKNIERIKNVSQELSNQW